ncbi:MAG: CoA pyrophosphatase [Bacteroidales bacterium]
MKYFREKLRSVLTGALPGTDVQWEMASSDRHVAGFPRVPGKDAREAAVLILLYPIDSKVFTVFMQRPGYDGVHGGQISFPGGKKEADDKDLIHTALREAAEETGINPGLVTVEGILTPLFIPVSNTIVTPVVGCYSERPHFIPDNNEVVFLIEAPVDDFIDGSIISNKKMDIGGRTLDVRYFNYHGHVIWGATAMILHELLTAARRSGLAFSADDQGTPNNGPEQA